MRNIAGMVAKCINSTFRPSDCPSKEKILDLHTRLQKHGYVLLNSSDGTSKTIACTAIRVVFIMEKTSAGYSLSDIPNCMAVRKSFLNQYFNLRSKRHSSYRIKKGPIVRYKKVDLAIAHMEKDLSVNSVYAPC